MRQSRKGKMNARERNQRHMRRAGVDRAAEDRGYTRVAQADTEDQEKESFSEGLIRRRRALERAAEDPGAAEEQLEESQERTFDNMNNPDEDEEDD